MEKKKNKGLIITIIILVILLLGLLAYICYDKKIINSNSKPIQKSQNIQEEKLKYEDSKIISTTNDEKNSLIIKVSGEWYEVANTSTHYEIFGEYNNKLYYSDDDAFKYIDLSTKDFTSVEWIKYEEKCYSNDNNLVGLAYADKGALKNDTIYFIMNSFGWNTERDSYVYTLNINATNYSDIKKEFKQEGIANLFIKNNIMYYYHWEETSNLALKKYNIETKETKTLTKNMEIYVNIYEKEGKIIYSQKVSNEDNANEKWYIYDLEKEDNTFIVEISHKDEELNSGSFQLYNNKIYYLDNDVIMKYENGKNEKIYKLDNIRHGGQNGYLKVINDNLFDYSTLTTDKYGYILNGEKKTKEEVEKYLNKYAVHMKNGEEKTFS